MNKTLLSVLFLALLSGHANYANASSCFGKSKTPWQKMMQVLYDHGKDTAGFEIFTLLEGKELNAISTDLAKSFDVDPEAVPTYSDKGLEFVGDVICQYMQLKYTKNSAKDAYYRACYSTKSSDYAHFVMMYPDSKYADEMLWKMNCLDVQEHWIAARGVDGLRLARHYSGRFYGEQRYEGFDAAVAENALYVEMYDEWESLMQQRQCDGYSDCSAFSHFQQKYFLLFSILDEYGVNDSIKNCKHDNAWREARAANTIEAYKEYIIRFPQGEHAFWARNYVADHEDWLDARERDIHTAYAAYCEKHPLGDSVAVAQERMRSIEESDWQRVKDSKNWVDIQAFLDRYPEGYYAEQASSAINALFPNPDVNISNLFTTFGLCSTVDTGVICIANNSRLQSKIRFTFTRHGRTAMQKNLQSGESFNFKLKNGTYQVVVDNPDNVLFGLSDPHAIKGDMSVSSQLYRLDYILIPNASDTNRFDSDQLKRIYGNSKAEYKALKTMYNYLQKNSIVVWENEYICIKNQTILWYFDGYNINNKYDEVYLTGDNLKETKALFAEMYLGDGNLELVDLPLRVVMFNPATLKNDVFEYSVKDLQGLKKRSKGKK